MMQTFENVKVPISLVTSADTFGGQRDQDCLRGDLVFVDRKVSHMQVTRRQRETPCMVLPKLTESHVHLDKCHTIHRMEGIGGDLPAAIAAQSADRSTWTADDIRQRATKGLDELVAAGCGLVRTHVDWGNGDDHTQHSLAWEVITQLASERSDISLQVAPLTGIDDLADAQVADRIAKTVAAKSTVLGSFVYMQPNLLEGVQQTFRVADTFGLALDFHVDEGLDPNLNGLEAIADVALETRFQGPVLCGHACSLMNADAADFARIADKLARAQVSVVSLPSANLYLQGRNEGTPDRRGITRINELQKAGVNVLIGTDNVRDAFCPLGQHNPLNSLGLAAISAHLDPPFGAYLPMITTSAEIALGLPPTPINNAHQSQLNLYECTNTADLLADRPAPRELSFSELGETA